MRELKIGLMAALFASLAFIASACGGVPTGPGDDPPSSSADSVSGGSSSSTGGVSSSSTGGGSSGGVSSAGSANPVVSLIARLTAPTSSVAAANSVNFGTLGTGISGAVLTKQTAASSAGSITGAASGGARWYTSGWNTVGAYWQVTVTPGNPVGAFSNLSLRLSMTGSDSGPKDFKVQTSYGGGAFTDGAAFNIIADSGGGAFAANAPRELTNPITIPPGSGALTIRLVTTSTTALGGGTSTGGNSGIVLFELQGSYSGGSASSASGEPQIPYPRSYSTTQPSALSPYDRSTYLRIGSFNIEIFGTTKQGRANIHTMLASIATNFDILAVQEVGSNYDPSEGTATEVITNYVARINQIVSAAGLVSQLGTYAHVRGHQYAFVYRSNAVSVPSYRLYGSSASDSADFFSYSPLVAKFTTPSGFTFALMSIHTSPDDAADEIPGIPIALGQIAAEYSVTKVGCLGDYNADGKNTAASSSGYYFAGGAAQGWLNGFNPASWFTVIKNGTDTTVSTNNTYTYDRMQITHPFAWHYTGTWGVLKFTQMYGQAAIDILTNDNTYSGTERALSDHYPIWMQFRYAPYQAAPF